jgi:hydrogenase maturation protease
MKTALIALGNPILGDDGIGWHVGKAVEKVYIEKRSTQAQGPPIFYNPVDFIYLSCGGLELMEHMVDYDRVILVDAIFTRNFQIFSFHQFSLDDFGGSNLNHINSAHDTSLITAVKMGRELGVKLPATIEIIGIEADRVFDFSEQLSPELSDMIPEMTEFIIQRLQSFEKMEVQHDLT